MSKKFFAILPFMLIFTIFFSSCAKTESTVVETVKSSVLCTTTYAGTGSRGNNDGARKKASFSTPWGIILDSVGDLVVADTNNSIIRQIDNASVSKAAGKVLGYDRLFNAVAGFKDGKSQNALLGKPTFMALLGNNSIAFSDSSNNMIRVLENGNVYSLAGGVAGGYRDGNAQNALFNYPTGIGVDSSGNLYVADTCNHCIRKISPDNTVTTYAGQAGVRGYADGDLTTALFNEPTGLAVDHTGAVYVSDSGNQRIRKIKNGKVTTLAGSGDEKLLNTEYLAGGYNDGPAEQAKFNFPCGLAVTSNFVVFVADKMNNRIRVITPQGNVLTLAGSEQAGFLDGENTKAQFNQPLDVAINANVLYVTDSLNNAIRQVEFREADYLAPK